MLAVTLDHDPPDILVSTFDDDNDSDHRNGFKIDTGRYFSSFFPALPLFPTSDPKAGPRYFVHCVS